MFERKKKYQDPFDEGGSLYELRDQYDEGEKRLIRRIARYGTRGIIKFPSPEGAPVSLETARKLAPARANRVGRY